MMVFIVWLGIVLWLLRGLGPFGTIYSAVYSEVSFRRLRRGMTTRQVESMMGPPLAKVRWGDDTVNWIYSDGAGRVFYWRRWVIFEGDKVTVIVSDLFDD
jgi:hypothetical protein